MILKTVKNDYPHQVKESLEFKKGNDRLYKENKELRLIFNIASDEFKKLQNELSSLKAEYNASTDIISELHKENNALKKTVSNERAKANKFASMLFGLKSEKIKLSDIIIEQNKMEITDAENKRDSSENPDKVDDKKSAENYTRKKNKGGQVSHRGHGRKIPDDLPITETIIVLPDDELFYGVPSNEWIACEGLYEESFIITKEVVWTKVRLLRQQYKSPLNSPGNVPRMITAPVPDKIIKKGKYDITVWVDILNGKYQQHVPIERQVYDAQQAGVNVYPSTIFGGLKKIYETYLKLLYDELIFELQKGERWHADETRWYMLCDQSKKLWYMWGFKTEKITAFVLDPTRTASVPAKTLLGIDNITQFKEPIQIPAEKKKILNVDRYSAYKMLERLGFVILSFCWAHQRRDFTDIIKKFPKNSELVKWAETWLQNIAKLYKINNKRIKYPIGNKIFLEYDTILKKLVDEMQSKVKTEIITGDKKKSKLKKDGVLDETSEIKLSAMTSMNNHWNGLNIFVNNPEVPMDNNIMENSIRPVALGRNNYIGSQSQWGGDLAACMYSIVQTCKQNNISPKAYLQYFLHKCLTLNINKHNNRHKELINKLLPHNLNKKIITDNNLNLKKY